MGLLDAAALDRKLALLATENARRGPGDGRDDLLRRGEGLEGMARRLGVPGGIAAAVRARAGVLLSIGRAAEACSILAAAHRELGPAAHPHDRVPLLTLLADAQARCGDWHGVLETAAAGIPLVELTRSGLGRPFVHGAFLRGRIGLYASGVRAAYELGQPERMLEWADLSKCQSALRYVTGADANDAVACDLRARLRHVSKAFRAAAAASQREQLAEQRLQLWDMLQTRRAQAARSRAVVNDLRLALAPDEAVLYYYWVDDERLLIVTIDDARIAYTLQVLPQVRRSLERIAGAVLTSDRPGMALEHVPALTDALLPAPVREVLHGKTRLFCSPHRLLHCLPFHVLRYDEHYLVDAFAITYVPNLASLLERWTPASTPRLLAVAVSDYAIPGRTVRSLSNTQAEAKAIASVYAETGPSAASRSSGTRDRRAPSASVLLGRNAGRAALDTLVDSGELAEFTCLHFATHGSNIESDTPMESSLLLYDSVLDGIDISTWVLNADLIVLSACSAGQRAIYSRGLDEELPGDDLFGLQSAFFGAGARRIMAALWPVDDAAGPEITTAFHRIWRGMPDRPEAALQRAIVEYRSSRKGTQETMVYYWAPFFLAGLGRAVSTHDTRRTDAEPRIRH